ncbi:MAG: hypothetical protein GWN01_12255 [Nitrosopumilaceae archaeon]|nr:hypothetical protein [Nitrosopumilaceae archaeon]NIU01647.1 hypothetical protein [Nitrosopumilaceae archaeon]NIV66317.1 hypothetical protein [Nitrosopumilaceae archaeon]NIX62249.1 hypothetical protein [Nitrosopumilaceae archaeon]
MVKLGTIDLEILFLGITNDGKFNENDIEESELKRLGVGKILDTLATLKDKNLIDLNKDGTFQVTELAKLQLWSQKIPLWVRILRLLEIKAHPINEISKILRESISDIEEHLEDLRKNQLVLMSPIRKEGKLEKSFEILQEGKEYLEKIESEGIPEKIHGSKPTETEILGLLQQITQEINQSSLSQEQQESIVSKLDKIKDRLDV